MAISLVVMLCLIAGIALFWSANEDKTSANLYKIEINRVENELKNSDDPDFIPDISGFQTITGVYRYEPGDGNSFFEAGDSYHISDIDGRLYRIEYSIDLTGERKRVYKAAILSIGVTILSLIFFLVYFYITIIRNFGKIADYPGQLSKGNLTLPLPKEKNGIFGEFLWGFDMLREKLEEEKKKNLELQKERNVFLLSLSHDIKTPVSAIKLYSAALKKNLYKDENKIQEVGEKIEKNAGEIEEYISKIVKSSDEDFLDLSVQNQEFYLSEAIDPVKEYYQDKLEPLGTKFIIDSFADILVRGDRDRFVEVLQNIMENAIKYGDGEYIRMSFSDEEDARLITVTNSGCTLKDSEMEHIFESFYRGSNVSSRPGSGLGLYIARKLINKMGGEIFASTDRNQFNISIVMHKMN